MAAKRTRQTTVATFGVTFELPPGMTMEKARKSVLDMLFKGMEANAVNGQSHLTLKVKVLERHVRYTERGTVTPDHAA